MKQVLTLALVLLISIAFVSTGFAQPKAAPEKAPTPEKAAPEKTPAVEKAAPETADACPEKKGSQTKSKGNKGRRLCGKSSSG